VLRHRREQSSERAQQRVPVGHGRSHCRARDGAGSLDRLALGRQLGRPFDAHEQQPHQVGAERRDRVAARSARECADRVDRRVLRAHRHRRVDEPREAAQQVGARV
jgi:hypothetical protein